MIDPSKDTALDKYHLDDEAKALPSIVGRYHTEIFNRTEELNELEFQLEKEEAVARKDARALFTAKGVKPTVDMVNDEVSMLPAIVQLRKDVTHKKTEVNYLKGVLVALDAKKSSLNNLVSLYVRDYWTSKDDGEYREADVKHALGDDYAEMAEKQGRSLAKAMKRRS